METDKNLQEVLEYIHNLAEFAESVMDWSFPKLDAIDPSFTIIAKYCEYVASIFQKEGKEHTGGFAEELAEHMHDIARAIVDRDDKAMESHMMILCDFRKRFNNHRNK